LSIWINARGVMRTITTVKTVFSFDELSDEGKEKALEKL
jgi:hypothetical protein